MFKKFLVAVISVPLCLYLILFPAGESWAVQKRPPQHRQKFLQKQLLFRLEQRQASLCQKPSFTMPDGQYDQNNDGPCCPGKGT